MRCGTCDAIAALPTGDLYNDASISGCVAINGGAEAIV